MNNFAIYCTKEQTKRALELGAPISRIPINGYDGSRPSYFTKSPNEEGYYDCPAYFIPTAEQMMEWLRTKGCLFRICEYNQIVSYETFYQQNFTYKPANNFKEASLAAIDAALDYLSQNKRNDMTIRERAEQQNGGLEDNTHIRCYQLGYIKGATEQKELDINKAYEWLKPRLASYELEKFKRFMED